MCELDADDFDYEKALDFSEKMRKLAGWGFNFISLFLPLAERVARDPFSHNQDDCSVMDFYIKFRDKGFA
ncbi:MAG: hypothetical protein LBT81_05920 [Helicobacteraceae bacterium]|jgi:hypothetical protein|nr:hypothetical protein [Helicobacteraceae bacterium]